MDFKALKWNEIKNDEKIYIVPGMVVECESSFGEIFTLIVGEVLPSHIANEVGDGGCGCCFEYSKVKRYSYLLEELKGE